MGSVSPAQQPTSEDGPREMRNREPRRGKRPSGNNRRLHDPSAPQYSGDPFTEGIVGAAHCSLG
jgi:hypothetical protein